MESSRAFEVGDLVSEVAPTGAYRVGIVRLTYAMDGEQRYVVEFEDRSELVFFAHELTLVRGAS